MFYRGYNQDEIDLRKFLEDIENRILDFNARDEVIANFVVVLNEHNFTTDMVLEKILGIRHNPDTPIDKRDCSLCFKLLDFVVDNDVFDKFFNSFN